MGFLTQVKDGRNARRTDCHDPGGRSPRMQYQLCHLNRQQLDQAFPLVQLVARGLTLERWRAFARPMIAGGNAAARRPPESGIVTAQDADRYIHGLFCYGARTDLILGRTLAVQHFVVGSLFDLRGVADALLDGIEDIARILECAAIRVDLSAVSGDPAPGPDSFASPFEDHGHRPDGVRLCKPLAIPLAAAGAERTRQGPRSHVQ